MKTYVVVGCKPWNRRIFDEEIVRLPGNWHFIGKREDLTRDRLASLQPRYVFFLHWSWKVATEVVEQYECVCFHMSDVPYGRGGSPLQNLILRGHRTTKLSALRMTSELDAGPVYMKEDLSLEGGAEEIYIRACRLSARMIARIIAEEPLPQPQTGPVTTFVRRSAGESEIPLLPDLYSLYDFIRMLDAEGYPKAFLVYKGFEFRLRRAALYDGRIEADVIITQHKEEKHENSRDRSTS